MKNDNISFVSSKSPSRSSTKTTKRRKRKARKAKEKDVNKKIKLNASFISIGGIKTDIHLPKYGKNIHITKPRYSETSLIVKGLAKYVRELITLQLRFEIYILKAICP